MQPNSHYSAMHLYLLSSSLLTLQEFGKKYILYSSDLIERASLKEAAEITG